MNFHETINSSALGEIGYRDLQKIITQTNDDVAPLEFKETARQKINVFHRVKPDDRHVALKGKTVLHHMLDYGLQLTPHFDGVIATYHHVIEDSVFDLKAFVEDLEICLNRLGWVYLGWKIPLIAKKST